MYDGSQSHVTRDIIECTECIFCEVAVKVWCIFIDVLDKVYGVASVVTLDGPDVEDEILFHIFFWHAKVNISNSTVYIFSRTTAVSL
jgi:hypothetical protein